MRDSCIILYNTNELYFHFPHLLSHTAPHSTTRGDVVIATRGSGRVVVARPVDSQAKGPWAQNPSDMKFTSEFLKLTTSFAYLHSNRLDILKNCFVPPMSRGSLCPAMGCI